MHLILALRGTHTDLQSGPVCVHLLSTNLESARILYQQKIYHMTVFLVITYRVSAFKYDPTLVHVSEIECIQTEVLI